MFLSLLVANQKRSRFGKGMKTPGGNEMKQPLGKLRLREIAPIVDARVGLNAGMCELFLCSSTCFMTINFIFIFI